MSNLLTRPTFTLAERLKIQQQSARTRDYFTVGRLTSVIFEAQRDISGLSQSRPRYTNSEQSKHIPEHMAPMRLSVATSEESVRMVYMANMVAHST